MREAVPQPRVEAGQQDQELPFNRQVTAAGKDLAGGELNQEQIDALALELDRSLVIIHGAAGERDRFLGPDDEHVNQRVARKIHRIASEARAAMDEDADAPAGATELMTDEGWAEVLKASGIERVELPPEPPKPLKPTESERHYELKYGKHLKSEGSLDWMAKVYAMQEEEPDMPTGLTPDEQLVYDIYRKQRKQRVEAGTEYVTTPDEAAEVLLGVIQDHGAASYEATRALIEMDGMLDPRDRQYAADMADAERNLEVMSDADIAALSEDDIRFMLRKFPHLTAQVSERLARHHAAVGEEGAPESEPAAAEPDAREVEPNAADSAEPAAATAPGPDTAKTDTPDDGELVTPAPIPGPRTILTPVGRPRPDADRESLLAAEERKARIRAAAAAAFGGAAGADSPGGSAAAPDNRSNGSGENGTGNGAGTGEAGPASVPSVLLDPFGDEDLPEPTDERGWRRYRRETLVGAAALVAAGLVGFVAYRAGMPSVAEHAAQSMAPSASSVAPAAAHSGSDVRNTRGVMAGVTLAPGWNPWIAARAWLEQNVTKRPTNKQIWNADLQAGQTYDRAHGLTFSVNSWLDQARHLTSGIKVYFKKK